MCNPAVQQSSSNSDSHQQAFNAFNSGKQLVCNKCKKPGHKAANCRGKEQRECRYCGIKGHLEADCRKKKRDQAGKGQSNGQSGGASANNTSISTGFWSFGVFMGGSNPGEMVLDSGCTGFMIHDKQLFTELDESYKEQVGLWMAWVSRTTGKQSHRATLV